MFAVLVLVLMEHKQRWVKTLAQIKARHQPYWRMSYSPLRRTPSLKEKQQILKNVFDETLNIILFKFTLECISFNTLGINKAILLPTNVTAVLREKHICRWQAKLVPFLLVVL